MNRRHPLTAWPSHYLAVGSQSLEGGFLIIHWGKRWQVNKDAIKTKKLLATLDQYSIFNLLMVEKYAANFRALRKLALLSEKQMPHNCLWSRN